MSAFNHGNRKVRLEFTFERQDIFVQALHICLTNYDFDVVCAGQQDHKLYHADFYANL